MTKQKFDVIIVGGGSAGAVLPARLSANAQLDRGVEPVVLNLIDGTLQAALGLRDSVEQAPEHLARTARHNEQTKVSR
jgi:choline dehydrogenase-like flavoprotein